MAAVKQKDNIDLGLAVLCSVSKRDETLTTGEIAEVCGCSQSYISLVARTAIKKLQGEAGLKLRGYL